MGGDVRTLWKDAGIIAILARQWYYGDGRIGFWQNSRKRSMRLTNQQLEVIKTVVRNTIKEPEIYVFGSRTDDAKRGGDIDILVLGEEHFGVEMILRMKILLKEQLGDRRIDLIYQQKGRTDAFAELVKLEGVPV